MFGDRCYGEPQCGHPTNWSCPCTCGDTIDRCEAPPLPVQPPSEAERLKMQVERLCLYVHHDTGCRANDFDYLDKTPCTCGLRAVYNPKGQPHT